MKRIAFVIAAVLLITGCSASQAIEPEQEVRPHHYGSFDEIIFAPASQLRPLFTTLDELKSETPNVVRGRLLNDAEIIFQFNDAFRPNHPTAGHNAVSLEIIEVFQGNLVAGEVVRILEPYVIRDRTLQTFADYLPSIPYQEYIFFLGNQLADTASEYVPPGYESSFFVREAYRGRYRVLNNNINALEAQNFDMNELSLGNYADSNEYMSLWQEVMSAFMN